MPEETPLEDNAFTKMASEDGDFDNFTYVNEHHLSQINQSNDQGPLSLVMTSDGDGEKQRPRTFKYSFAGSDSVEASNDN